LFLAFANVQKRNRSETTGAPDFTEMKQKTIITATKGNI
jgi:hypothetical protein